MRPIILALLLSTSVHADHEHIVPFTVNRVYDGDTVMGIAHLWPNLKVSTAIRLRNLDTPELRGGCAESRKLANQARMFADSLLTSAKQITIRNPRLGKYAGRVVADVFADGQDLGAALLERKLAKPYDGKGLRPGWCPKAKPNAESSSGI